MSDRERLAALLGAPPHRRSPEAWTPLERELGVGFPDDYKEFIDGYGPVRINFHLHFGHPAHPVWSLGKWVAETVETYRTLDWPGPLRCPAVCLGGQAGVLVRSRQAGPGGAMTTTRGSVSEG